MTTYVGLALVIGIVLARWGYGYWHTHRVQNWWRKGQEAVNAGNLVAAEAAFRECVRLAPIVGPFHRAFGGVLARRGKLAEAEERLRFGAELEPRNAAGFMDLGYFLALCVPNRSQEAIEAFARAVVCAPDLRKRLAQEPHLAPLLREERFRRLVEPVE